MVIPLSKNNVEITYIRRVSKSVSKSRALLEPLIHTFFACNYLDGKTGERIERM
jgi:hypothetical protein